MWRLSIFAKTVAADNCKAVQYVRSQMQSDELAVSKASLISFPTTVLFPLHFLAVWIRCGLMLPLTGQSWYYDRHYYVCAVQDKNALANYYYCASSLVTLTFSNQLRSPCVFIVLYQQEQVFLKAHLACQWVNAHVDSSLHWEFKKIYIIHITMCTLSK